MIKPHGKKGLTLIEIVMAMVVVAVLVAGLSFYIKTVVKLYNFVSFRNEVASQGKMAVNRMIREIRQCDKPSKDKISAASSNSLTFTDINNNLIIYDLNGTDLRRNSVPLASNITGLTLTYYDKNDAVLGSLPLSAADRQKVVRIAVQATITYGSGPDLQTLTVNSQVYLRNL